MEVAITRNRQELDRLEGIIKKNLSSFYEFGCALMEIRDRKLYSDVKGYETFEAYCKAEWSFNSSRARQLIGSAQAFENLQTVTPRNAPKYEFHVRPLVRLEPEKQREVWQRAVETAPEGRVTAAHVIKMVKASMPEEETQSKGKEHESEQGDSKNLANLKTDWHSCSATDKKAFMKWIKEYFYTYIEKRRGE